MFPLSYSVSSPYQLQISTHSLYLVHSFFQSYITYYCSPLRCMAQRQAAGDSVPKESSSFSCPHLVILSAILGYLPLMPVLTGLFYTFSYVDCEVLEVWTALHFCLHPLQYLELCRSLKAGLNPGSIVLSVFLSQSLSPISPCVLSHKRD